MTGSLDSPLLSTVAPWLPLLVFGRGAQAMGSVGLIVIAMNLAGSASRMGLITAGLGVCGALGPLAGSLVSGWFSWHAALVLAAVSLLAVPALVRLAPAGLPGQTAGRFDLLGAVLLAVRLRARPDGFVPVVLLRTPVFLVAGGLAFALSWVLAAVSARMSRPAVLTVLIGLGALAPLTAAVTPWAPLLLAVYAADSASVPQRPTAIGLFSLCYHLGGAFGPAIVVLLAIG